MLVSAAAAPEVGIALLTVALVCGLDGSAACPSTRRASGPRAGGRSPALRVAGVLLAIGGDRDQRASARAATSEPLLLGLALRRRARDGAPGGRERPLARATGEPFVAALVN